MAHVVVLGAGLGGTIMAYELRDALAIVHDVSVVTKGTQYSIVCARPDNEEPGQPSFAEVARAAEQKGLKAVHIPISGGITEGALIRMEKALKELPMPMYGYCRSGGRAGSLYSAALRAVN